MMLNKSDVTQTKALELWRGMLLIRRTEEQLAKSYAAGLIPGACHTYVGEEAVATGVCAHLRHDDAVFSTHRGHGHALAKGVPPREVDRRIIWTGDGLFAAGAAAVCTCFRRKSA